MPSQYSHTVVQTISNPDGTVSIIHVDPNNPIITLPDGTQAHVQGVTTVSGRGLGRGVTTVKWAAGRGFREGCRSAAPAAVGVRVWGCGKCTHADAGAVRYHRHSCSHEVNRASGLMATPTLSHWLALLSNRMCNRLLWLSLYIV